MLVSPLKRICIFVSLGSLLFALGCARSEQETVKKSPPEASWSEQVLAVSRGEQDQILIEASAIRDEQLTDLSPLSNLKVLKLQKGTISDRGLATLRGLGHLEQLVLRESSVTNQGAESLSKFPALRILNLPQSEIGDDGLKQLAQIRHLELLRLGSSQPISADALQSLKSAKELRFLHFIDIPLTDDALAPLGEIETLESLYIDGAILSDDALSELLKKRPKLHLHLDQKHHDSDPKSGNHPHS